MSSRRPRKLKFNEAAKRVLDLLATDLIENTRSAAGRELAPKASRTCGGPHNAWPDSVRRWRRKTRRSRNSCSPAETKIPTIVGERETPCGGSPRRAFQFLRGASRSHAQVPCRTGSALVPASGGMRLHRRHDRSLPAAGARRDAGNDPGADRLNSRDARPKVAPHYRSKGRKAVYATIPQDVPVSVPYGRTV